MINNILKTTPPLLREFKNKVNVQGDKTVLISDEASLTYQELDSITDALACQLILEFNKQRYVPVYTLNNMFSIMAILATWKAGKVYLPFNPGTPPERINTITKDLNAPYIWSNSISDNISTKMIPFKTDMEIFKYEAKYEDIAYVLTTSGSTGTPKKVEVTHENINWLLATMQREVPFGEMDKFLVSTPPAFDVSLHEMLAFIYGQGEIVTYPSISTIQKVKQLPDYISKYNITHLALSPSACAQLIKRFKKNPAQSKSLSQLLLAGEEFPVHLAKDIFEFMPSVNLYNLYGPTETTIYATIHKLERSYDKKIPIGVALEGTEIKFLNKEGELSESSGEVIIGGYGVTNGYLGNRELTKNQFIKINGSSFYKTGDYGYLDIEEKVIIYEGRKDDQVQVNGIRVELGEIDKAVRKQFPNNQCKTIYTNRKLISFIEIENISENEIEKLSSNLKTVLPSYMVPSDFFAIKEFTLTSNRKLDHKRLISLYNDTRNKKETLREVQENSQSKLINEIQLEIQNLFKNKVESTESIVNKLKLDSLDQLELILHLEEKFSVEFPDDALLFYPTAIKLASHINSSVSKTKVSKKDVDFNHIEDNILANTYKLSLNSYNRKETYYIQKSYYIDGFKQILSDTLNVPPSYSNKNSLEEFITKLVKRHSMLQVNLSYHEDILYFKHFNLDSWNYRLMEVSEHKKEDSLKVIDYMKENALESPLWYFIYESNLSKLHIYINHHICDQSSLNILKQDMYMLFHNQKLSSLDKDYWDFIRYQDKGYENYALQHLSEVDNLGFSFVNNTKLIEGKNDSVKFISFNKKFDSTESCITFTNYVLLQALINGQNESVLSGSTILDIRDFDSLNIDGVIGDLHSTIPLVSKKGESYNTFKEHFSNVYSKTKQGHNINHYLYRTYPEIPEVFKPYEYSLDDNLKFSSNYLGAIRENQLEEMISDLQNSHAALKNFSTQKWYVTFFHTGKDLIIVPLSQPNICSLTIEKLGGEIIYEA